MPRWLFLLGYLLFYNICFVGVVKIQIFEFFVNLTAKENKGEMEGYL
jgi:hypothetical protein